MPELPEVEVIRRDLVPCVEGRRISMVSITEPRLTRRRGKYLFFDLGEESLVVRLGMTGQLLWDEGRAGFLPDERAYLDRWLESGWVDLGRAHGGPGPGPYTWWSWRGKAFDNDAGWRIDYVLATPSVAGDVASVAVGRAAEYAQRWSDHAPVVVDFDPEAPLTHRSRSAPPVVD